MPKQTIGTGVCAVPECGKINDAPRGLCSEHYRRWCNYGTFERLRRPKGKATCSAEGCDHRDDGGLGLCRVHYMRRRHHGHTGLVREGGKRSHPLYHLWFDRKANGCLAPEWLDFKRFVADISPAPEGYFFLVRVDGSRPYGPDNFKWQEHLRRRDGETRKEWHARKWAARVAANPGLNRNRDIVRKFGLSIDQYQSMVDVQGGKCAICGRPETASDPKTGTLRRLSVDHCHKTGAIRELLCFACNSAIGRLDDDPERLRSALRYLLKHQRRHERKVVAEGG